MATSAGWALQQGICRALAANEEVIGLLGGANIFDDLPQNPSFPYLTLGQTSECDWGAGSENGSEHTVTLHVWSHAGGREETEQIIDKVRAALNASPIAIDSDHLVNLRHEYSEARYDEEGETCHGIVRYRAVTQPIN